MTRYGFPGRVVAVALVSYLVAGCSVFAQPPGSPAEKDVVYGTAGGEKLLLDVYRPAAPGPHPAVIAIHGGGWRGGDKSGDKGLGDGLTANGIACFSLDYRLAPKHTYPAQVLDVARAVRWVRAHAKQYDIDPNRLATFGGSAGGHLSLMLGVIQPGDFQSPDDPNKALSAKVQCVVDLFGPADFRDPKQWPPAILKLVQDFLGTASPAAAPAEWAEASPITHVTRASAPTLMIHGDADSIVPLQQSEMMKAAFDKADVRNKLIVIKHGEHGFGGGDPQKVNEAYQAAFVFLAQQFGIKLRQ
jgi:alpha-L-fucosidase 2